MAIQVYGMGTGRRKEAVARVIIKTGDGKIIVNSRPFEDYFTRESHRLIIQQPLELTNVRSRFNFDRAFVGKFGFNYLVTKSFRVSGVLKYYDGRPFARRLIIKGLNQGPFYIMAGKRGHERNGKMRTEYNLTLDLRLEKKFKIKDDCLRLMIDIFNLLNGNLATREYDLTGPKFPLRPATEIQSPRVIRIGFSYDF